MPIFFDDSELTEEQRARYDWAVREYRRIQAENHQRLQDPAAVQHRIGPQSALFARLLEGKQALPYPPPTSYDYPWYDIIEKPGQYHVCIQAPWAAIQALAPNGSGVDAGRIVLNQCEWAVVKANDSGETILDFLRNVNDPRRVPDHVWQSLLAALAACPEILVTFGQWGQFRLFLGRTIRRGKRRVALASKFDLDTFEGGNPEIVKTLHPGAAIRAKSDATLAMVRHKQEVSGTPLSALEKITLASESAIAFAEDPQEDDLVEYDCDGWVLERL